MAYCDYDFYLNVYFGSDIAEEDFPRLAGRASDYIRAATRGLSDTAEGGDLELVGKCTCAIADILLDESIMTAAAFSGEQAVSSESVGGWSRSYKTASLSAAEVAYIDKRKGDALQLYLGTLDHFAPLFRVRSYPCRHQ